MKKYFRSNEWFLVEADIEEGDWVTVITQTYGCYTGRVDAVSDTVLTVYCNDVIWKDFRTVNFKVENIMDVTYNENDEYGEQVVKPSLAPIS
jgi:hypothetical protein